MIFFILSIFAGVLTILAPCILPLLPVIIGASGTSKTKRRFKAFTVIASLSVSVIVFTLLLRASALLIDIPPSFWTWFSGGIIFILGVITIFPKIWSVFPMMRNVHTQSNKAIGTGFKKNRVGGDILIGAALGPVFTTCSPTYFFLLATVLPASFWIGFTYLLGFTFGMALSLSLVAIAGQAVIAKFSINPKRTEMIKKILGALFILVGLMIITGSDKKLQTSLLDMGIGGTVLFEERLIEQATPELDTIMNKDINNTEVEVGNADTVSITVPKSLLKSFPDTDWSQADPIVENALSGGPGKDGIPALNEPRFTSLDKYTRSDSIQAIVLRNDNTVKVYPYNILIWHEIVNDVVNGIPVAVTFCPLCGSAIVYDRTLPKGVTTFGVSGFLIESNMVMFDRSTETIWQQSTGKALAGEYFGTELSLVKFQLLTMGDIRAKYPNALVLSEKTGYRRAYGSNPYSGYDESDDFLFSPSTLDARFPAKAIFVAFKIKDTSVAAPWLNFEDGVTYTTSIKGTEITLIKESGEMTITTQDGVSIPFYFEMWFSWAVQNGDDGVVFEPS